MFALSLEGIKGEDVSASMNYLSMRQYSIVTSALLLNFFF